MTGTVNILYLNTYENNDALSKHDNIYQFLKHGIITNQLLDLLPSVRTLAQLMDVNKNTISKVMEALVWDEYLIVKPKVGYWCNTALVQYKADQVSLTKKKLPIILPHSPERKNSTPITLNYDTLLSIHRNAKNWLQNPEKDKLLEHSTGQLKSFISKTLNTVIDTEELYLYANVFWLKFQILQSILQDGDEIMLDRNEIQIWPLTQLNKEIKIIPFPQNQDDLVSYITNRLEAHDSVRCIIITKHIILSKMTLLNLLSLCYKYGVLLIQTQQLSFLHQEKNKSHFAKSYDYNNYVIHLIELPQQVAGIICDRSIVQIIKNNMTQLDEWEQLKIIHNINDVLIYNKAKV